MSDAPGRSPLRYGLMALWLGWRVRIARPALFVAHGPLIGVERAAPAAAR